MWGIDRLNKEYITIEEVFVPKSSFIQEGEWWYARVNINTDRIISFVMKEISGWGEFATIIKNGLIEIGVYYPTLTTADKVPFTVVRLNSI